MTSKLTREQLHERARENVKALKMASRQTAFESAREEILADLQLAELALAAMDSEPVAWINGCNKSVPSALRYLAENPRPIGGESSFNTVHLYQLAREIELMAEAPLYRHAQPAPEKYNIGDATMCHIFTPTGMTNVSDMQAVFDRVESVLVGMERTAPEYPEVLPCPVLLGPWLRFGKGIKTSTMLAALARRAVYESDMAALSPEEIAEFQARIEDFKALIAQPAPVVPDDVLAALQKVARIRLDLNDFDGDRRGIADCLGDAEEALIEVVNRRAAMLSGGKS